MGWIGMDWKELGRAEASLAHNLQLLVSVKRHQFLQHVLQQTSELSALFGLISLLLTTYDAL
jgi:hypothetical protein